MIEVHLTNASVTDGVALHWHGIDVPNSMDGVAGVTQDAVPVGGTFTYRFVAGQAGTYWYHSHQVSDKQVTGGLFGALVIKPRRPAPAVGGHYCRRPHLRWAGRPCRASRRISGPRPPSPVKQVRVRVINTDNGPVEGPGPGVADRGAGHRRVATCSEPTDVIDKAVTLTGGARVDLGVTMPADGSPPVRVQISKATAVIFGTSGEDPTPPPQPAGDLDLLSYGRVRCCPLANVLAHAARQFEYSIGHRPGFVKGRPGLWWSINGHLYPNVPMYVVREGDVVTMHIDNHSGEVHPMHLHGHHAVVLARNGVAATGSQWWFDTLNVADKGDSTTSPLLPTIRASGWTTATTFSTPRRAWWRI